MDLPRWAWAAICCLALGVTSAMANGVERLPPVATMPTLVAAVPPPPSSGWIQAPQTPPAFTAPPTPVVLPPEFSGPAEGEPSLFELIPPTPDAPQLPSSLVEPELLEPGQHAEPAGTPEEVAAGAATPIDDATVLAPPPKIWCGRLEAGVNGASGNTELFTSRFGGKLARETPRDKLKFDLLVARSESFGKATENKAILETNNDLNFFDSSWAWFVNNLIEYDEFRNFDLRVALHTGFTYHYLKGARGFLDLRTGAGTSREIGGPDNKFVPETKFGFDAEFKITPRQKLTGTTDAFIDVSDPSDLRCNSRAGYAVLIDADRNLNIELGILNRYDSSPNGVKPNDLNYNMLFFWEF